MIVEQALPTLVLIAVAAVLAPILAEQSRGLRIPTVVIELLLGIALGRYALNIAHLNDVITALSDLGLGFLMFMAGYELDWHRVRGRPLTLGVVGWLTSLAVALGCAFVLVRSHLAIDTLVVGLALTTTALGTLLPVVSDAGMLETRFGAYLLGIGTAGEFGPVVAVSVLFSKKDPLLVILLLLGFVAIATVTAVLASNERPPRLVALLHRHLSSSAQLPVRVAILLVLSLVALAFKLGLDVLLGAFAAGIVVRELSAGVDSQQIEQKLQAIGFGFLIPIFFIVSGINFDLHLLRDGSTWLRVLLFLCLFLVVRGLPVGLYYRRALSVGQRLPMVLFSSTGLPLIVVITSIGVDEGRMRAVNAAALVTAGILSVILFPAVGLRQTRQIAEDGTDLDAGTDANGGVGCGDYPTAPGTIVGSGSEGRSAHADVEPGVEETPRGQSRASDVSSADLRKGTGTGGGDARPSEV